MISTQYIKLNMVPNGIPPVLYCSQYDVGRPLGLVVYNGSEVVDLSTYTATIEATRTDRTPITAAVTTDGNIGVFNTTATMTNKLDRYGAKLVLSDSNGNRVASLVFFMVITLKTMDENAEGIQEDQSLYQQYTATVQTIIAQIRSDLVAEANARQAAVNAEASARQAADQTLQQNINAEASARQSADNTLQSNINAEASTRATQDASLQSQIDQLVAPSGEAPSAAEVENARIGSDGTVYPTLGDAIRTQNSLLKSHLRELNILSSNNVLTSTNIETGRFYNLSGTHGTSSTYNCTKDIIKVNEGDVVRFYDNLTLGQGCRYITAYNGDSAVSASGVEYTGTFTVPSGIDGVRISFFATATKPMITINNAVSSYEEYFDPYYVATSDFLGKFSAGRSSNLLDHETITSGKFINTSGTLGTDSNYAVTDYIPVSEGDVLVAHTGPGLALAFRFVTAYNYQKNIIPSSGAENAQSYTVPNGVAFVRISTTNRYLTLSTTRINSNGIDEKFQEYYYGSVTDIVTKNYKDISNVYKYPLTSLPEYINNILCYRPLGQLSKGYVCLVSDDGDAEVETYTIPMCISKEVPCTLAMMSASEVLQTTSGLQTVLNAVNNYGFCVAQHGGENWTHFDEYYLNTFFDSEAVYWNSIGITPHGAVCPEHGINNMIKSVAGGRFGCVRTGYILQYNYSNGVRSNIFALSSQSSLDGGLENQKMELDTTLANKWLRMIHWHENEMTAEDKTVLEGLIDYGKQIGLTFITMEDIPTIT